MLKIVTLLFFGHFLTTESKFYETDIGPYGYGGHYSTYNTHEYDPEVGYPYGLSYKKYPDIPYKGVGYTKAIEYEEPIISPVEGKYGHGFGGLGYAGKLGGYYGAAHGYPGYPIGAAKGFGYGYGPEPGLGFSPIYPQTHGPIHGLGFYGHHGPYGAHQFDKAAFTDGKQNIIGEHHNRLYGVNGESLNHGDVGFNKGEVAYKDIKGDSVHFLDSDGINSGHHNGKAYSGGHHFDTEGNHGTERVLNANHNKGHNIKGFKKSHHLDETGKTEEFFDEDHDAGGNYAFDGKFGKFGEQGGNSYKGGFNDGRFKTGGATKQGHYDNEYFLDKAQGGSGKFGGNKYAQNEEAYGLNKGIGEHNLAGLYENNNVYRKYPIGYGGYY